MSIVGSRESDGWAMKGLRTSKGLHADDLAVHLDMNGGHLSDIERGKREAGSLAGAIPLAAIVRILEKRRVQ